MKIEIAMCLAFVFLCVCGGIAIMRVPEVMKGGVEVRVMSMQAMLKENGRNIEQLYEIIDELHPERKDDDKSGRSIYNHKTGI